MKLWTARGRRSLLVVGFSLWASAFSAPAFADSPIPSLDAPELAHGPFSAMHMLLTKTFLRFNVATIDVRFDGDAQAHFADLARGKSYSDALGQQLAQVAINDEHAVVQMRFERDVGLDTWVGVVRDNLDQARAAGLITRDLQDRVSQGLPQWFAALHDRGYKKGDRLLYAVKADGLRTVVASPEGRILVDREDHDQGLRRVVLASYFAPRSDFREPLLQSLFEGGH
jgi:hypothetical protein